MAARKGKRFPWFFPREAENVPPAPARPPEGPVSGPDHAKEGSPADRRPLLDDALLEELRAGRLKELLQELRGVDLTQLVEDLRQEWGGELEKELADTWLGGLSRAAAAGDLAQLLSDLRLEWGGELEKELQDQAVQLRRRLLSQLPPVLTQRLVTTVSSPQARPFDPRALLAFGRQQARARVEKAREALNLRLEKTLGVGWTGRSPSSPVPAPAEVPAGSARPPRPPPAWTGLGELALPTALFQSPALGEEPNDELKTRLPVPAAELMAGKAQTPLFIGAGPLFREGELLVEPAWRPAVPWFPPPPERVATKDFRTGYKHIWGLENLLSEIRRQYILRLDLARVRPRDTGRVEDLLEKIPIPSVWSYVEPVVLEEAFQPLPAVEPVPPPPFVSGDCGLPTSAELSAAVESLLQARDPAPAQGRPDPASATPLETSADAPRPVVNHDPGPLEASGEGMASGTETGGINASQSDTPHLPHQRRRGRPPRKRGG